ncbi:multivesicular body subunit 12B isoform X1 [Arapaima gigas]
MTLPANFTRKSATRPDHEHQNSNLYAISEPWCSFARRCSSSDLQPVHFGIFFKLKSLILHRFLWKSELLQTPISTSVLSVNVACFD